MKIWESVLEHYGAWKGLNGAGYVDLLTMIAGERGEGGADSYLVNYPEYSITVVDLADDDVQAVTGSCIFAGAWVSIVMSAHAALLYAGTSATDTLIWTFPSGSAVGVKTDFPNPFVCPTGIFVDTDGAATGTILILSAPTKTDSGA